LKRCTMCNEAKQLSEYHNSKRNKDGKASRCKVCIVKASAQWKKDNPERNKVHEQKHRDNHRSDRADKQRKYYQENKEYYADKAREWLSKNPDYKFPKTRYDAEYAKRYREGNRELIRFHRRKRKAKLRGSIVDFSKEDYRTVLSRFEGKCALTESTDIHMDHFIPVSTGHGHTTLGNMIPLDASLNLAKHASNPFEWIKERNDIALEKFEDVVLYLAELNGFSREEYEAHVYNCFN